MVYYIRFLKTPRAQIVKPGLVSVSALISISTDLGDAFLAEDVVLQAQVVDATTENNEREKDNIIQEKIYNWEAGRRELSISIGPFRTGSRISKVVLVVGPKIENATALDIDLSDLKKLPLVVSGWSAPFSVAQEIPAEKLVERRIVVKGARRVRIWEETGNNIARHIWDAALPAIACLQDIFGGSDECTMPRLQSRFRAKRKKQFQVIELGAGCGVVGIALARILAGCSVTLTDLAEVEDVMGRNLQIAQMAPGSDIRFKVLDWDEKKIEADTIKEPIDLILVSDCTYNADSLPALVRVMKGLVESSPEAVIVVSLKRRHDSEAVFFDLMRQSEFVVAEQSIHRLPAAYSEEDIIEIFAFERE